MGPERGKDSRSRKSKGMSRGKASNLKKKQGKKGWVKPEHRMKDSGFIFQGLL